MKIILKIILFPIALAAQILFVLINILAVLSAYIVGPICLFIIVCALISVYQQSWLNVGILSGMFVSIQVCYFAAAMVTNLCSDIYGCWARI